MSMSDWAARLTWPEALKTVHDGKYVPFVNTLIEKNPFMQDIPIIRGNGLSGHEGSRVTQMPTPVFTDIGEGWAAQTVKFQNFTAVYGTLNMRLDIPKKILDRHPNKVKFRADLENACGEGFGQGEANFVLSGTSVGASNSKKFDGLSTYYTTPDATDPTSPTNGDFGVFDGGGTDSGALTSMWMMQPGEDSIFFATPSNSETLGLRMEDYGIREVITNPDAVAALTETAKSHYVLRTEWEHTFGLVIMKAAACVRIRNVNTNRALFLDESIFEIITRAREEVFTGDGPIFLYMNRHMRWILKAIDMHKTNVQYDSQNPYKIPMSHIDDITLRVCDAIPKDEAYVAAA